MNADHPARDASLRYSIRSRIDEICDRFEDAYRVGDRPILEQYLLDWKEPERASLLRELLSVEVAYRRRAGEHPTRGEYEGRFSDQLEVIRAVFPASEESSRNLTMKSTAAQRPGRLEAEDAEDPVTSSPPTSSWTRRANPMWPILVSR